MNIEIHKKICEQYYNPKRLLHKSLYLFDLDTNILFEDDRTQHKVINRMQYTAALIDILYNRGKLTLVEIGKLCNRNHATIIYRYKVHKAMMYSSGKYRNTYCTRLEMFSDILTIDLNINK